MTAPRPGPGEVYREFKNIHSKNSAGQDEWRVTGPEAEAEGAHRFLPNPVLRIDIDDLADALRAEMVIHRWGGHPGTLAKRVRVNGHPWIDLPEPATVPGAEGPEPFDRLTAPSKVEGPGRGGAADRVTKYLYEDNPVIEVPLDQLRTGANSYEGTAGPGRWPQWGWTAVVFRIYYRPSAKAHPTGIIAAPGPGETLGENPRIAVHVSGDAERVDLLAFYEGYDENGDGVYRDWHGGYFTERGESLPFELMHHAGSAASAPWEICWDTRQVPDQPEGMKLVARIRGTNGYAYVTETVGDLKLSRPGPAVRLYRAAEVPPSFQVRMGRTMSCKIPIPESHDLARAIEASCHIRTWNGDSTFKLNDYESEIGGVSHKFKYSVQPVPLEHLRNSDNTFTIHDDTEHHGKEQLWPGPGLVVRYEKQPRRGA